VTQSLQAMQAALKNKALGRGRPKLATIAAKKSPAQRLSNDSKAVQRFTSRYGSDVAKSTQKKSAKRKGFLSRIAGGGYRG
jgi:hypothetical protein